MSMTKKKEPEAPPRVLYDPATSEWFRVSDPGVAFIDESSAKREPSEG